LSIAAFTAAATVFATSPLLTVQRMVRPPNVMTTSPAAVAVPATVNVRVAAVPATSAIEMP
jgi:hypothetical protein